jgi:dTDP-4-dehydrorhamnose reductase
MKKVLILGSSGLTGYKAVQLSKERNFEVYGTFNTRVMTFGNKCLSDIGTFINVNLNKEGELKKVFADIRPDILLNCVAFQDADECELFPEKAYYINSRVVGQIAQLCNTYGSRLVHISTDYVFDGKKGSPYVETDIPNPLSVYARSKLNSETEAMNASSYSIIRTSVIYGWTPMQIEGPSSSSGKSVNFGLWALNKLRNNQLIRIVNDQLSSPTLADTLASVCLRLASTSENGIFHVAGSSCISRFEFTRKIANVMGYASTLIKPIGTETLRQRAARPRNSCLNCDKVQNELRLTLPNIENSLCIMKSQIVSEAPSLLGKR